MKKKDLLLICIQNLMRHKARTMLTVLGVIVGCCSIIIMVSIGVGMREAQEKMLQEMGDLTLVTVYPAGKGSKAAKLTNKTMKEIKNLPQVDAATPKLTAGNLSVVLYAGSNRRYKADYIELVGMEIGAAEKMGYKLKEGAWEMKEQFKILAGEYFAYAFADSKRPIGRNMINMYGDGFDENDNPIMPPAYFQAMKTPVWIEIDSGKEDGKKITQKLEISGRLKEDYGKGSETSSGLIMNLSDLENLIGLHNRQSGKKNNQKKGYETAVVKVKEMKDVASVEKSIQKMGFRTSSMESIRKPMEKEARQKQMMMGGLGAISLLVAALGITNTMIMSISERTREIGVMKSLGCFVRDIRMIFLLEAGFIGLMGGVVGAVFSIVISVIMNVAASGSGNRLSVIPWWLIVFALVFSVLIGLGAGYYPANKAVGIPALEAIKHD